MKKKPILLVVIALLPLFVALLGYSNLYGGEPKSSLPLVRALLVNPVIAAMLGGVVSLILQHRRAIWWAMVVVFFYSYLGFGLVWGGFWSEGLFGVGTLNSSAVLAAIGFVGALFTYGMVNIIRKSLANLNRN